MDIGFIIFKTMSNQYINFYYDPSRQGYDTEAWSLLDGLIPVVNGGYMILSNDSIRHYGDILRGDFVFGMNFATGPATYASKIWGLNQANKGNCLTFNINGTTFSANSSDGNGNTNSVVITWQNAWTLTDTEFRIRWEAGLAHFYVGGSLQAVISDISITGEPMSLYLSNANSIGMLMKYIEAKAIQSYFQNTPLTGSQTFGKMIMSFEQLTVSEAVTINETNYNQNLIVDSLTTSDVLSPFVYGPGLIPGASKSDTLAVSENITNAWGPGFIPGSTVSDSLTSSENISVVRNLGINVVEQVGILDTFSHQ
jgi:hypothetical protein